MMTALDFARRRIGAVIEGTDPSAAFILAYLSATRRLARLPACNSSALFWALHSRFETWFNSDIDASWQPKPGDIVFLASRIAKIDRSAFVERIDLDNFAMWVISTDAAGTVDRFGIRLSDERIVAFVRP